MTQQAPSADRPSTAVDAVFQPAADTSSPLNSDEEILPVDVKQARPVEIGGREGPEPTRFGDWEMRGRCIDF
jgi:hypothetical protein